MHLLLGQVLDISEMGKLLKIYKRRQLPTNFSAKFHFKSFSNLFKILLFIINFFLSMAPSQKSWDISFLSFHGYHFNANVKKNSVAKVKFGDKTLACKKVQKKSVSDTQDRLEIIRKLSHPHIVPVHSVLQNRNDIYFFMQWIDSGNLLNLVKTKGMVKESVANFWFFQLVCGVKYLHDNGYAHCHLNCSHVMISRDQIKITGLQRIHNCSDEKNKKVMMKCQKSIPDVYCAPEMNQKLSCDPKKCDVFSLGVILFIILNAAYPFNSSTLTQLIDDQINKKAKIRTSNIQRLSVDCQVMLFTLMEPNGDVRYSLEKIQGMKWLSKFLDNHGDSK